MSNTALIIGATGCVGRELVKLLLKNDSYEHINALVRKEMDIVDPKLTQHMIDFNELAGLSQDLVEGATIFCTIGTTMKKAKTKENFKRVDYDYPMIIGRLASDYGAAHMLIVTAMGANERSMFFYSRVKGQVERDLQKLGLRQLHIFRPSLILGEREEHRTGEQLAANIARRTPFLFKGIMRKYKPIEARTIARAMMNVGGGEQAEQIISSDEIERLGDWK